MAVFERQLLLEIHPFVTEPLVSEEGQGFLRETLGKYVYVYIYIHTMEEIWYLPLDTLN